MTHLIKDWWQHVFQPPSYDTIFEFMLLNSETLVWISDCRIPDSRNFQCSYGITKIIEIFNALTQEHIILNWLQCKYLNVMWRQSVGKV